MNRINLEARKERAWNSPEAQRRRACAEVNDNTAAQMLRALSDAELAAHILALEAEHKLKRASLQACADALARADHEAWRRDISFEVTR